MVLRLYRRYRRRLRFGVQFEKSTHLGTEMLDRLVALMVVAACFGVVQLHVHHGVDRDHAGGPLTVSAWQWTVPKPQLTDTRNQVELTIPDLSTGSDHTVVNSGKRRRKFVDHVGHRYGVLSLIFRHNLVLKNNAIGAVTRAFTSD